MKKLGTNPRYNPLMPSVLNVYRNNPTACVCSFGRPRFNPAEIIIGNELIKNCNRIIFYAGSTFLLVCDAFNSYLVIEVLF